MPWRGADYEGEMPSLGWSILEWCAAYLPSPRDERGPLIFTDEQARGMVDWYSIDPVSGQYIYRRGCSRRSKGWGKSPREAAKAIAALVGPVVFAGWNADGEPVGRPLGVRAGDPDPWIQIAAVSEDQTENTYSVIHALLNANDARAADDLGIDVGLTRCYLRGRPGKLEPVTASAGSREGQPVTDSVMDETQLWTPSNGGVRLARTIRRNVAKMGGRSYETTNSFVPGERSVAEGTHKAHQNGTPGIYYDAIEAPSVREDDTDGHLKAALSIAYGDSWWVNLDRIVAEIRDPETPWEDAERFFFNHNCDDRRKAIVASRWAELARPDIEVPRGSRVGLGFDGSISDDATALRGCTFIDGRPHTFAIKTWIRPDNAPKEWRIPRLDVAETVAWAMDYYDVGRMLCDPAKWHSEIEGWALEYGDDIVIAFDTNSPVRMSRACDRWLTALAEGAYTHDADAIATAHVLAMHKKKVHVRADDDDGRTRFVFVKGPDRLKIDAGIADVLAVEAAATMPEAEPVASGPATVSAAQLGDLGDLWRPSERLSL